MRTITRFQIKGTTYAIVELDDGSTHTFNAPSYLTLRGADAASLQPVQATRAAAQPGNYYTETPHRAPSIESDVKVPFYTALFTGALTGAMAASAWVYFSWPKPIAAVVGVTLASTWYAWRGSVSFLRGLLVKIEEFTQVDLDGDGNVGQAPARDVLSPFPVRTGAAKATMPADSPAAAPAPKSTRPGPQTPICIRTADARRTARVVTLGELWDFLRVSHQTGDWTKATWTGRGMSQPLWTDYQNFLTPYGWWKFNDPTLLRTALSRFCAPANYLTDYLTNYPQDGEV